MLTFLRLAVCLLALADSSRALKQAKSPKNAILLSNVKSLTLRADAKTSHRRLPAIPQYEPLLPFRNTHTGVLIPSLG